ncbi:hypothetical protein [Paraburkholderia sacchari]|uniref:hypothetical protein n=1 Tax=Paraburkholderia sacchari TaxID=159450 RepID=UPI0005425C26|nr:hypothetical protein [Paraburkholderia sacchari]NLP63605.1 hypothetical protein [Paraburkholderia sacchari]
MTTNSVPVEYVGVWKRSKLRRGTAPWDFTTRVFWLQTPFWHADIRIAPDRPDFSNVKSLADCNQEQLDALLTQEAFCGTTTVEDDVCRWTRYIDYRLRDTDDFGQMVFDGNNVEEIGIETDYYELWHKLPESLGRAFALQRNDPQCKHGRSVLCVAGDYFIYSRDRPMWTSPAVRTRRKIQNRCVGRRELEAFLDFESSFGTVKDGVGMIEMSTLPWREGQVAFDLNLIAQEIEAARTSNREVHGWAPITGSGEFRIENTEAA